MMTKDHCTLQKRFMRTALVVLLAIALSPPSEADPAQAFLKVNQYYVLFTNPIVPFRDKTGNFIVGLQGFSELIGAQVVSGRTSTTVHLGSDRVKFIRDSKTAYVNGKAVQMAEAPQERRTIQSATLALPGLSRAHILGPMTQTLVPLNILAHAFHMRPSWQAKTRTLSLQREDLALPVDNSIEVEDSGRFESPALDSDDFAPFSVALRPGSMLYYHIPSSIAKLKGMELLDFTARNTSSRDFVEGQTYINIFSLGGTSHGMPMPSVDIPSPIPLPLKAGATRSDVTEVNGPNSHFVRYIVAWLVVRDLKPSSERGK